MTKAYPPTHTRARTSPPPPSGCAKLLGSFAKGDRLLLLLLLPYQLPQKPASNMLFCCHVKVKITCDIPSDMSYMTYH
jgi:hypothetical protein